jgi:hypothetical protein
MFWVILFQILGRYLFPKNGTPTDTKRLDDVKAYLFVGICYVSFNNDAGLIIINLKSPSLVPIPSSLPILFLSTVVVTSLVRTKPTRYPLHNAQKGNPRTEVR